MGLKRIFRNLALKKGHQMTKITSDEDLIGFFEMVRPISIKKGLIRIGGIGDGGYLLPDDLENIEACFSPGVAETATFEEDMANRGVKSYMADYSVDSSPVENKLFNFEKKYLGDTNDDTHIRLEDWVKDNAKATDSDLLLQMDIEGAEFSVILDTPIKIFRRFRIMAIEFHRLERLLSREAFPFINQVFKKLTRDFSVVHIHPNNSSPVVSKGKFDVPVVVEFTFYRNDRVEKSDQELIFPHALDSTNDKRRPDFSLPACWR